MKVVCINNKNKPKQVSSAEWLTEGKEYTVINLKSMKDFQKNINYRNEFFLNEILKNPIYFSQLFLKRAITMSIIHPFWVNQHFYFDRTNPEAKNNPKKYYNKNLLKNIPYSIFIYFISFTPISVTLALISSPFRKMIKS
jgi:hypothetical protein